MSEDTIHALKRRLSAYETEILILDRSRDELKESVLKIRAEINRREKEAAYARNDS